MWQFDVWPLEQTWAFKTSGDSSRIFRDFLSRRSSTLKRLQWMFQRRLVSLEPVYSGDDQFFDGILDQVLEINREENPFPVLCVVRSLAFTSMTGFSIGPRLAQYLTQHATGVSDDELADVQVKHYGRERVDRERMRRWLDYVAARVAATPGEVVRLGRPTQMTFWPEEDATVIRLHLFGSPWPTDGGTPNRHQSQ
ncbi:MAG: hypothetical protein R3B68_15730 [Phycisphaerales bacterium]